MRGGNVLNDCTQMWDRKGGGAKWTNRKQRCWDEMFQNDTWNQKRKKKECEKTTLFWVSEEGFAVLVHTGKLWLEAAVSSLEVKSSFPICITGCYGDVMRHCCDATQATGVFDNCRLFTTLEGLKTVTQQLHFFSSLFFSPLFFIWGLLICCFASDLCLHSSGWQSLISSHFIVTPCSIRWVI